MELTYYTTHTRMDPWLIGVLLGYFLNKLKGKHLIMKKVRKRVVANVFKNNFFILFESLGLLLDGLYL